MDSLDSRSKIMRHFKGLFRTIRMHSCTATLSNNPKVRHVVFACEDNFQSHARETNTEREALWAPSCKQSISCSISNDRAILCRLWAWNIMTVMPLITCKNIPAPTPPSTIKASPKLGTSRALPKITRLLQIYCSVVYVYKCEFIRT